VIFVGMATRKRKASQDVDDSADRTSAAGKGSMGPDLGNHTPSIGIVAPKSSFKKDDAYFGGLYNSGVDFRRLAKQHPGFAHMYPLHTPAVPSR
jgi:hypothetical protein